MFEYVPRSKMPRPKRKTNNARARGRQMREARRAEMAIMPPAPILVSVVKLRFGEAPHDQMSA